MTDLRPLRSLLFAPANRESLFEKAMASGADAVCVDLEDAVPPDQKDAARPVAVDFLRDARTEDPVWRGIRINTLRSPAGLADLAAVCAAQPRAGFVLLSKTDAPAEVEIAAEALATTGSETRLGALIESASGLENVFEIARASDRLAFLLFGAVDLSAELGTDGSEDGLAYARGRVVHAARAAHVPVLDVPALDFRDLEAVAATSARAVAQGFSGKAAIHPSNVTAINAAFTPSASEIAEAREVVAAFEAAPSGLVVRDGKLIERPVIRTMQRRLSLANVAEIASDG